MKNVRSAIKIFTLGLVLAAGGTGVVSASNGVANNNQQKAEICYTFPVIGRICFPTPGGGGVSNSCSASNVNGTCTITRTSNGQTTTETFTVTPTRPCTCQSSSGN